MRTYKYKLLSAKRNKKLHRQINAGALAWNHCVAFTRRFYRFYGKSVSENALKKHLTKLKKRVPYGYLREMGSQALQDVVERLYRSYKRFFDAKKNGEKCGLPGFKKVRKYKSFTLKQAGYKLLDGNDLDFPTTLHSSLRICIYFLNFSKNLLHFRVFLFIIECNGCT